MHLHDLHPQHLEELTEGSGIDTYLASLNFTSLQDSNAYDYLLISAQVPRTNTGMVRNSWLQRYSHITSGGWWCSGLDPQNHWQAMEWGCFKPNLPRLNQKGKSIKYEHPPGTATRIFCLRVTLQIWQKVAQRYNINISKFSIPENQAQSGDICPNEITLNQESSGFWQWVMENDIPIIICEGVKKAAALLSLGYVAIAIPGITSGYRVKKDNFGKVLKRQLIPDLAIFTISKRTFYICFDFETEPRKIAAVDNAISQLGVLLQSQNCLVKVIKLPGDEKGIDEFIVNRDVNEFDDIYSQSLDLEIYLAQIKPHTQLTLPAALTVNRRYLGEIPFPTSGLVGVKSAKGTGKTTALQKIVRQAKKSHQPVLLITHRIQLGKFLCEKIGIQWRRNKEEQGRDRDNQDKNMGAEEIFASPVTLFSSPSLGLCVDSIWKLNPEDWHGGIIILDEVEQSLWHLLHSTTCKDKRVKLLKSFQQLIDTVITTGGLIIAQDADLSDVSLEYLQQLSGLRINPWVLVNQWQPEKGWDTTFYDSPNPTPLIQQLELDILAGRKCYVTTDSRAGRYSCETIERYLKERLEKLHKIFPKSLLVSSRTTNTPGHNAVDFVAEINQKVTDYDVVFVTPSLGTGVSIDVQHFDRVYGIFQGVIPDSEARQALARVRDNVPRVVWCAKRGIGLIGSGSTNYKLLSDWYQENQRENLALLSPLQKIDVDLPLVYDPIHLRTWAKVSARVNASISIYRQSMKEGLMADGHQIWMRSNDIQNNIIRDLRHAFLATESSDLATRRRLMLEIIKVQKDWMQSKQKAKEISHSIRTIKKQNQYVMANAVANAKDIDYVEYEHLSAKHALTEKERQQINKYLLWQKYGVKVTPELKLRDEKGYYSQLLIHYYLTHESEYFRCRDKQELYQQLICGEGKVFLPDLKSYTLKVEALRALGMQEFLDAGREFVEEEVDLNRLKNMALQCSQHIKRVLGINLVHEIEAISGIKILNRLLSLLGLKLKRVNQISQTKIYKIDQSLLNDGREEIFAVWHQRDKLMLENAKLEVANLVNIDFVNTNIAQNNTQDNTHNPPIDSYPNQSTHVLVDSMIFPDIPITIPLTETVPF
ncbi:plasmid replication protein, CyRepA1 family [Calothrix sp. UHCC 0171]|uniref:plasmid replication protein, CyRepA1 family n=1 Tax=Calothrix sp. UHCC 0171 TaxID=3110245 RepID=UPI002B20A831|nr:plasmid replication protein, CyRepA1 family [Calothrix sp. UHCC 0171]MEA5573715.1 plasmid replication protein, CyRepA1 family [Calothrix sp. UHCC 0171]